jgi:hypothetical protein
MARLNESLRSSRGLFVFWCPFVQRNPVVDTAPSDPVGYNATGAKIIPGVQSRENIFSIYFRLTEPRDTRFSPAMNVIAFVRSDPQRQTKSSSYETFKTK